MLFRDAARSYSTRRGRNAAIKEPIIVISENSCDKIKESPRSREDSIIPSIVSFIARHLRHRWSFGEVCRGARMKWNSLRFSGVANDVGISAGAGSQLSRAQLSAGWWTSSDRQQATHVHHADPDLALEQATGTRRDLQDQVRLGLNSTPRISNGESLENRTRRVRKTKRIIKFHVIRSRK